MQFHRSHKEDWAKIIGYQIGQEVSLKRLGLKGRGKIIARYRMDAFIFYIVELGQHTYEVEESDLRL